jgi:hypothetical protein
MTLKEIGDWIYAHREAITHFRPRKWCGQWSLYAYNRNLPIPFLDFAIPDTEEAYQLIREILGPGHVEEPLT